MFQTLDFKFVECCARKNIKEIGCSKKIKIKKNVNDDELVISSTIVILEVNERGKQYFKTLRDIRERMYRHTFHLQYKNQSNDSKNRVIRKIR